MINTLQANKENPMQVKEICVALSTPKLANVQEVAL
jgi:hypothetical protein